MTDVPVKYFKLAQIPLTWEPNAFYAIQIASDLFEFYLTTEAGQPTKLGLQRKTITFSSGDIGVDELGTGTIELAHNFMLERVIATAEPLRFRLYQTFAQLEADQDRDFGDESIRGSEHGLNFDLLLNSETGYNWQASPAAYCMNGDSPMTASHYWSVSNLKGSTQAWEISLQVLILS